SPAPPRCAAPRVAWYGGPGAIGIGEWKLETRGYDDRHHETVRRRDAVSSLVSRTPRTLRRTDDGARTLDTIARRRIGTGVDVRRRFCAVDSRARGCSVARA